VLISPLDEYRSNGLRTTESGCADRPTSAITISDAINPLSALKLRAK
jgi:hypothetical protein